MEAVRGEGAGPGSRQPEPVPRWEGGLAVLDDDDAPSHAVAAMGEDGSASPSDDEDASFPPSGLVGPLHLADVHRCVQHAMDRIHFPR